MKLRALPLAVAIVLAAVPAAPAHAQPATALPAEVADKISSDANDVAAASAFASDYLGEETQRDAIIAAMDPERARHARVVVDSLNSPVTAPDESFATAPVVVLGNGLNPDGTVHKNLALRLEEALKWAQAHPRAPVITTGGETQYGHVEAEAMAGWLVGHGLAAERITTEGSSWSTISNAWHTRATTGEQDRVVVVTSESHLHRAVVDFQLAMGPDADIAGIASPDHPAAPRNYEAERSSAYRDAVLWYLLPNQVVADALPPLFGPGIPRFWEPETWEEISGISPVPTN